MKPATLTGLLLLFANRGHVRCRFPRHHSLQTSLDRNRSAIARLAQATD